LTDDQISRHGYGSLPAARQDRDRLAAIMLDGEGSHLVGQIPGIYRNDGRLTISGRAGILIPVLQHSLIVGIQIRHTGKVNDTAQRYTWLSSRNLPDGCGSGAPSHVAMPDGDADVETVIITEGIIKANITADRMGRAVIAVPGVTITADVIPLLTQLGATGVWLAYDNDAATKPEVARAEQKLIDTLSALTCTVHRLSWAVTWKGVDDALTSGIVPVAMAIAFSDNRTEASILRQQLKEERAYTRSLLAASNSRHNGPEARTAANIVHDLKMRRIPVGQWIPMTRKRISTLCGISKKTASNHKHQIAQHFPGALEFENRHFPRSLNRETGEIRPPHDLTFVRLLKGPVDALTVIAGNRPPVDKNGNGGRRTKRPLCRTCGPGAGLLIESRTRCKRCNEILSVTQPHVVNRSTLPGGQTVPREKSGTP